MHVDEGTIHAWLDGELPAEEGAALESHVATCTSCAAAVAEARGLMAASSRILGALDEVPAEVIPRVAKAPVGAPRRAARRWWQRPQFAAAAGLVVMAVGSTVVFQRSGRTAAIQQASPASPTSEDYMDSALPADRQATPAAAPPLPERARAGGAATSNTALEREGARVDAAVSVAQEAKSTEARAELDRQQEVLATGRTGAVADSVRQAPVASASPLRVAVAVDSLVANEKRRAADEVAAQRAVPAPAPPVLSARRPLRDSLRLERVVVTGASAAAAGTAAPLAVKRSEVARQGQCYSIARSAAMERAELPERLELLDDPGPTLAGVPWRQVRAAGRTGDWFWREGPGRFEVARITNGVVGEVFALVTEGGAASVPCS